MPKVLLCAALALFVGLAGQARAEEKIFELKRMVVATAIEEREPVGSGELFSADQDKLYAFIEARNISKDTEATFVWSRDGQEVARVLMGLRQGSRWRTYSSITLAGRSGDWRVELEDETGAKVRAVDFRVQ